MIEVSNVEQNKTGGYDFDEKGIRSRFRWSFEGRDDTTVFTSEVDYEIPGGLLGKLAEHFIHGVNEREADVFGANLKARLEAGRAMQPEAQPRG